MKRRVFSICLISIVGLFLFPIHDKTEAENWELFFKDGDSTRYYDKDSIHYPYNTRGSLGSITTDKNSVRVWVKTQKSPHQEPTSEVEELIRKYGAPWRESLFLQQVWCSKGEIQTIEFQFQRTFLDTGPFPIRHIIPGSWEEKLYNEVCK